MQKYFAALSFVLLILMVLIRVRLLKRQGIDAFLFGKLDTRDFLIPPIALFYFYTIIANTLNLPLISSQVFFRSEMISWIGVGFCLTGLFMFLWSLFSFGLSFRVGIDVSQPNKLVTTGIFAYSRNPIYIAFAIILLGQFLIFSNWILLVYLGAAIWLFHRQVLLEEEFLKQHYGDEYLDYCNQVRRYI